MNEMNDNERLQRMLEEATASERARVTEHSSLGHSVVETCAPEAAGLRDAWLAFGRLLEAADAAQSGDWKPESIQPHGLPTIQSPAKQPLKKQPEKRGRKLAAMAAAAAALIIAVGLGWWMSRGVQPNGPGGPDVVKKNPQPDKQDDIQPQRVAANNSAPLVAQNESNKTKESTTAKTAKADPAVWDDPIETQIASVSEQIDSVRQNWQHRTDDADMVQYRIDEISAGLSKDAL